MATNKNLQISRERLQNEFYTQLSTIGDELRHQEELKHEEERGRQVESKTLRKRMNSVNDIEGDQIMLASPEKILSWSYGEVKKSETINYRTLKPEPEGLFCERIFGPTKDWECHCGKYRRLRYKGFKCDRCGVEITESKVRRERMGHISLAAPVAHSWYYKGVPSRMGLLLNVSPRNLERVIHFDSYIVIKPGDSAFKTNEVISDWQYRKAVEESRSWDERNNPDGFKAGMGAEAVKELLEKINLEELYEELRTSLNGASGLKKIRIVRRLEVVNAFRHSGNKPEWMIMDYIPVIPPDLRPQASLDGRTATSDLNDLYRRVINRNNRIKTSLMRSTPEIFMRNDKRMLQEAVDALIDNGCCAHPEEVGRGEKLKSLSDMLNEEPGVFRQNLLEKKVVFSSCSAIIADPDIRIYQCGLSKRMALELFEPFIMKKLIEQGNAYNIESAKKIIEKKTPVVWSVLEAVIREYPVMVSGRTTIHRSSIQAFEPTIVGGKAIKLHPLVCTSTKLALGEEVTIHVPLSEEAQAEARFLMLSVNNFLDPKDGSPITTPTQDMILGSYYLTHPGICRKVDENGNVSEHLDEFVDEKKNRAEGYERVHQKGDGKIFTDFDEMMMAYQNHEVELHSRVKVRVYAGPDDKRGKLVQSTVGRFIFNQEIPQDLGYVDRRMDLYSLEANFICDERALKKLTARCYDCHHSVVTVLMLEKITELCNHYATGAITIGCGDIVKPSKPNVRDEASVLEYFISSNGARKGLADTALRTADSGYLTRRLVDVSHNVSVREFDCGTDEGIRVRAFTDGKEIIEHLRYRIEGRTSLEEVRDPITQEILVEQNEEISKEAAKRIEEAGIESVAIRSVMTCHSKTGICAKCYGRNLATGEGVNIGEAVGVIAALCIGELLKDANGDISRVEELFEARNLNDVLRLYGVEGVYQYLIKEVQRVYKNQGVDINDKHVEVIVSQMLSKLRIENAGDTNLLPGGLYSKYEIEEANEAAEANGGQPCEAKRVLLGITKASLATNSFLSAASFQETTRVLTDAAIKGKTDHLQGLKENVIIGKLIPAGTGMKRYRNIDIDYGINEEVMREYEHQKGLAAIEAAQNAAMGAASEAEDITEIADMDDAYEDTAMMHITELGDDDWY